MIEIRDYNGDGRWSRESIERRFESYTKSFGTTVKELKAQIYEEGQVRWVYPLVNAVIEGIEKQDPACVELGIELIEDSDSMPFGMMLKSNAARALRRSADVLTEVQKRRIRQRVAEMLIAEYMPREFLQYVKLVRAIGAEAVISQAETSANMENPWVRRYLERIRSV
jgi:hypothetical protein